MALVKITIVIGAGIIGSVLLKEGRFSVGTDLFSSTLKVFTRHLQQDKDSSRSTSKPSTNTLLTQMVNSVQQELQTFASSGSVTVITTARSGSQVYGVTTVLVVGCLGFGYIWWKGWRLSDMMFVTRRGFSGACSSVGKQLEHVSSSITSAKRHLSSKIDVLDDSLDEMKGLNLTTKTEVIQLCADASLVHIDVESVTRAIRNLESKMDLLDDGQNFAGRGLYALCKLAEGWQQSMNTKSILDSPANFLQTINSPGSSGVSRAASLPPLSLESPSPSSMESPKIVRPSITVSAAGLKELQEVSNPIRAGKLRTSPGIVSNAAYSVLQPSSSTSNTGRFSWKIPSINALTRTWSNAN